MRHDRRMILFAALALASASVPAPADEARAWEPALRAAEHDLCGKQVALLGENGFHGEGKSVAFRAALIPRLVTRCGFRAVFFEASQYDFVAVERAARRRRPLTEAMILSAIGGKWNKDRELAPLVAFLAAEARRGRVTLGGLDDQLGSAGAFYSLDAMPAELAAALPAERREPCRAALAQRLHYSYSDASPHDPASIARLRSCLAEMRAGLSAASGDRDLRDERLGMIASAERDIARDFMPVKANVAGRDLSMYLNFRWLAGRLPRGARIIVWAANQHVAKDAALDPNFTPGGNLGAYIHRDYGARAFALGFTSASGSFRWTRTETKPIPPAAPGSLEALLAGGTGEAFYAGTSRLRSLGTRSGALFNLQKPSAANWADLFDGIVVFRAERPPVRTDEQD
jgi:erythromycin esterase-like protein